MRSGSDHRRTPEPLTAAASTFPSDDTAIPWTWCGPTDSDPSAAPFAQSHSRRLPSSPAEASDLPSGKNASP